MNCNKYAKDLRTKANMFFDDMMCGIMDKDWIIRICKAQNKKIHDAANVIEELQNQLAAVTAERDAAVEDLKRAIFDGDTNSCTFCKHENSKSESPYCLANFCDNDEWEWRGKDESNGI